MSEEEALGRAILARNRPLEGEAELFEQCDRRVVFRVGVGDNSVELQRRVAEFQHGTRCFTGETLAAKSLEKSEAEIDFRSWVAFEQSADADDRAAIDALHGEQTHAMLAVHREALADVVLRGGARVHVAVADESQPCRLIHQLEDEAGIAGGQQAEEKTGSLNDRRQRLARIARLVEFARSAHVACRRPKDVRGSNRTPARSRLQPGAIVVGGSDARRHS